MQATSIPIRTRLTLVQSTLGVPLGAALQSFLPLFHLVQKVVLQLKLGHTTMELLLTTHYSPAPIPAKKAAPKAETSVDLGLSTGLPVRVAIICTRKSF
ncbi:hypothetical protein E2C01_004911 [Portunus trituberculatus]|uniref:Uncharacterized protein n=1 Tax=Portunus trituberculatus TaxID=210409 RepID=A0A5B7CR93_PORTR|nr:hypothetical protein [Portunus trituberculatus]